METLSELSGLINISFTRTNREPFVGEIDFQRTWDARLTYQGREMVLTFLMGTGLGNREPTVGEVLSSVLTGTPALDETFEDFCADFGYDTDSRKAEAIYKTCLVKAKNFKRLCGKALYNLFLAAEDDI